MAKQLPRAGRPHKTPGSKPAPRKPGATSGTVRERAGIEGAYNPLGAVNGPEGGTGNRPPAKEQAAGPKPDPQGGSGS